MPHISALWSVSACLPQQASTQRWASTCFVQDPKMNDRKGRSDMSEKNITIRLENKDDYRNVENLTR